MRKEHKTHPGYVLAEDGDLSLTICPLTSSSNRCGHIPEGSILEKTGHIMNKDSYVVPRAASRLPRAAGLFPDLPAFLGIFPPEKLVK